jgi:hypothetical protein
VWRARREEFNVRFVAMFTVLTFVKVMLHVFHRS